MIVKAYKDVAVLIRRTKVYSYLLERQKEAKRRKAALYQTAEEKRKRSQELWEKIRQATQAYIFTMRLKKMIKERSEMETFQSFFNNYKRFDVEGQISPWIIVPSDMSWFY